MVNNRCFFSTTVSGHVSQDAVGAVGSSEEVEAAFPASLGSQTTFATDLLTAMHSNLPMPVQVDYIFSLRKVEAYLGGAEARCWKLFAGGAVSSKALGDMNTFYTDNYEIDLRLTTEVFA